MDELRYFLGLVIIMIMPVVIVFWLVIHGGSSTWRKNRPQLAYLVAGTVIAVVVVLCWRHRMTLVGTDLGFNLLLFISGAVIYLTSFVLWRPVKQHLNFRTFAGIPEVANEEIDLIRTGPFAMVRHPRYLMVAVGVLGWCLMANYAGAYGVGLASLAGLLLVIRLEERDLVQRFGAAYLDYQREVPAVIPTWNGMMAFLANRSARKSG